MTTNNNETRTETALSVRQEKMLAVRDEMAPGGRPGAIVPRTFAEVIVMCQALAAADLAPKNLRGKATDMALVIMTGAEVGLPPMASLRLYTTWDGVPRLMAEGVRAIILQSPEVEYFEMATCDDNHATWIGKRRGRPEKSVTWTVERAKRAGLLAKDVWQKYQQDMLNARASMQLGRIIAPDVVAGMVALEEARDGDFIDAASVEAKPVFVAPPAPQGPPPGVPQSSADAPQTKSTNVTQLAANQQAVTVTDTGTQPSEPPKRGPGRPPKDKPAPSQTPGTDPFRAAREAFDQRATDAAKAPATTADPDHVQTAAAVVVDAGTGEVVKDRWNQAVGPTSSGGSSDPPLSPEANSTPSETSSIAAGTAPADDFGGEDPPDSQQAPTGDPALVKLEEMRAFIASCKNRRQMDAAFPEWRDWTVQARKAGDARFEAKTGELTKLFGTLWSARKAELPE